jgi:hypothetical protein
MEYLPEYGVGLLVPKQSCPESFTEDVMIKLRGIRIEYRQTIATSVYRAVFEQLLANVMMIDHNGCAVLLQDQDRIRPFPPVPKPADGLPDEYKIIPEAFGLERQTDPGAADAPLTPQSVL